MGIINHLDPKTCILYCNIEHVYIAVYIQDILQISFRSIGLHSYQKHLWDQACPSFLSSPPRPKPWIQETLKALIAIRSSSVILVASWYYTPCRGTLSVKVVWSLQPRIQWLSKCSILEASFIILVQNHQNHAPCLICQCKKNTQKRQNPKIRLCKFPRTPLARPLRLPCITQVFFCILSKTILGVFHFVAWIWMWDIKVVTGWLK